MVAPNAGLRSCYLMGGVSSFVVTLRPKLLRWGLDVQGHMEMGREGSSLPLGFDVYLGLVDVVAKADHLVPLWRYQAEIKGLRLVLTQRKESAWHRDFPRAGLQQRGPVAAAALNDVQAGEEARVTNVKVVEVAGKPKTRDDLLGELGRIAAQLKLSHGLKSLTIDEEGNVEVEVEVVKVSTERLPTRRLPGVG